MFLKSKIKSALKNVKYYDVRLVEAMNKYNKLVQELKQENSFPSFIGKQQNENVPQEIPPLAPAKVKIKSLEPDNEDMSI